MKPRESVYSFIMNLLQYGFTATFWKKNTTFERSKRKWAKTLLIFKSDACFTLTLLWLHPNNANMAGPNKPKLMSPSLVKKQSIFSAPFINAVLKIPKVRTLAPPTQEQWKNRTLVSRQSCDGHLRGALQSLNWFVRTHARECDDNDPADWFSENDFTKHPESICRSARPEISHACLPFWAWNCFVRGNFETLLFQPIEFWKYVYTFLKNYIFVSSFYYLNWTFGGLLFFKEASFNHFWSNNKLFFF